MKALAWKFRPFSRPWPGVKRIDAFLSQPERVIPEQRETAARGDVVLSYVTFGYGEKPVLRDFSMTVRQGEQVTLVGRTGAGKSTVFKLLLGLYRPEAGTVTIGGVDVSAIPDQERRTCIGCVEQHFSRVPGTVLDQITLGDPQITEEMAKNAAQLAGIDAAIQRLAGGLRHGMHRRACSHRASGSFCPSPAPRRRTRRCCCWTRSQQIWTPRRRSAFWKLCAAPLRGGQCLSVSHRVYENLGGRTVEIKPQGQ